MRAVYYRAKEGVEPVDEFIESLPANGRRRSTTTSRSI
jgi:hypothetical protein